MGAPFLHVARNEDVESILADGLRTGSAPGLTLECAWILAHYRRNPVFLCREDSDFYDAMTRFGDYAERPHVEVDVDGIDLVADLAALVDHKGVYHASAARIGWRKGRVPEALRGVVDRSGFVAISRLLDPRDPASAAAIATTATAAALSDISPDRLALRNATCPVVR